MTAFLETDSDNSLVMPASIGQQVFTIGSGVAGGLAGLILASRLTTATHVKATPLLVATLISVAATFGVVFMISEGGDVRQGQ
jgi:hypothetical protein